MQQRWTHSSRQHSPIELEHQLTILETTTDSHGGRITDLESKAGPKMSPRDWMIGSAGVTMDQTTARDAVSTSAGIAKRTAQTLWKGTRAFVTASPRIVAVMLIASAVALPPLAYFGWVRMPLPDPVTATIDAGAAAEIRDLKSDVAAITREIDMLAAKGDVAHIAARVEALEAKARASPVTTGSISKSGKK